LIPSINKNKKKSLAIKLISLALVLNSMNIYSQTIEVVKFEKLQSKFKNKSDTTYIVNFFASWCSPCIAELPSIVKFSKENKNTKYKVILVSLDLKKNYLEVLPNLIEKFQISQTIYLLDESDSNSWINKVDKNWSGQIPATFITNGSTKKKKLITDNLNFETIKK
jgi:thiol-disulfide isomerase/thioredoxin